MGMSKEDLKTRIAELDVQIFDLGQERGNLRQQLAEMNTAFKVGDRVTYEGAKCVWVLTAIKPGYRDEPKYFGSKIKKDGTPGVNVNEIWQAWGKKFVLAEHEGGV
jgi:hypothetical protein